MGRMRQGIARLTDYQRQELRRLADSGASDAELLAWLLERRSRGRRSSTEAAELLHSEFNVPLEAAREWLITEGLGSGLQNDELADRCWRWIHRCFRGTWPARRISRLTQADEALIDARAAETARLVTAPVARSREKFERALLEAYRLAGLSAPRVLWVEGPGSGLLLAMLCYYRGPEGDGVAELLSERRFARVYSLDSVMAGLCAALRPFMPAGYEAELPRYLTGELLGPDIGERITGRLIGTGLNRLDPVRSTRLSSGILAGLKQRLGSVAAVPAAGIKSGVLEAMRLALRPFESMGEFLQREPGVWWQDMLGSAAVAHTATSLGTDPTYPLACVHKVAWALATEGFWSWLGGKVAICAEGPTAIGLNDAGLLHSEGAAALAFRDGMDVYAVEGHVVPDFVITHPESITKQLIEAENSAEIRRVMIDAYGRGRWLTETGAQVIEMDMVDVAPGLGAMPRALMQDREQRRWLVGTDGSTRRVYYMRVPDRVRTCSEAHEALAGFDESKIIASS